MPDHRRPAAPDRAGRSTAREDGFCLANVRVVDLRHGEVLPPQDVRVRNGRVTAVGPAMEGGEPLPRTDCHGLHLLPGLCDMHVHFSDVSEGWAYLTAGVTTVRNMSGSPFHRAYASAVAEGACVGPRLISTSPILDGRGPSGKPYLGESYVVDSGSAAARYVADFVRLGYTQVKVYSWLDPLVHGSVGAACRDLGVRLVGHCPMEMTFEQAIGNGQTCFEHWTNLTYDPRTNRGCGGASGGGGAGGNPDAAMDVLRRFDWERFATLIADCAAGGVFVCPTLTAHEPVADQELTARDGWEVRPDISALWSAASAITRSSAQIALDRMYLEFASRVTAQFQAAGGSVLAGTDTPDPCIPPGRGLHRELDLLSRSGMGALEALRSATAVPAGFLGAPDDGFIEVGSRADLVLLRSNPLADVRAVRDVEEVVADGVLLDQHTLGELRAARGALVERPRWGDGEPRVPRVCRSSRTYRRWSEHSPPTERLQVDLVERPRGRLQVREILWSFDSITWRTVELDSDGCLRWGVVEEECPLGQSVSHFEVDGDRITGWVRGPGSRSEASWCVRIPDRAASVAVDEPGSLTAVFWQLRAAWRRGRHALLVPPSLDGELPCLEGAIAAVAGNGVALKQTRTGGLILKRFQVDSDGWLSRISECIRGHVLEYRRVNEPSRPS